MMPGTEPSEHDAKDQWDERAPLRRFATATVVFAVGFVLIPDEILKMCRTLNNHRLL